MKQDLNFCFGVVDCNNEGCSCSSFSVVMEKSMTNEWEERDVGHFYGLCSSNGDCTIWIVVVKLNWKRNECESKWMRGEREKDVKVIFECLL
jgi:hypothetical protein